MQTELNLLSPIEKLKLNVHFLKKKVASITKTIFLKCKLLGLLKPHKKPKQQQLEFIFGGVASL